MKSQNVVNYYENNLSTIKKSFPLIFSQIPENPPELPQNCKIVENQYGSFNLIKTHSDGTVKSLYGVHDPVIESQKTFRKLDLRACDILFFVGMGLGYHTLTALQQFREKPTLVVFEPSFDIFLLSLQYLDLTSLLSYPYLDLYVGAGFDFRMIVGKYISPLLYGKAQLLSCFPPPPFFSDIYESGYNFLQEWLKSRQESRITLERSSRRIFQNTVENLPSLFAGQSLRHLRGALKGMPAFCVAAGPSLNDALVDLKKVGNQGIIIALDSAVQVLVEAGIKPHVVVTADFKEINFEKLRNVLDNIRDSVLIFALGCNAKNVSAFLGRRRVGVSSQIDLLEKWLCKYLDIDCQLPNITSVGQTALFTASALGLEPIVLVGMDLSFPEGLDHARSTVFRSYPRPDSILLADGVDGRMVFSQAALVADKVQIEKVIAEIDTRIINTSRRGVLLKGTETRSLSEVVECELKEQLDVGSVLKELDWEAQITIPEIIHAYQVMLTDLSCFLQECKVGIGKVKRFFSVKVEKSKVEKRSLAKKIVDFFEDFKNRWADVGNLLSAARFKEYQELKRCQIKLARNKALLAVSEVTVAEMEIIRDDLTSVMEAANFFAKRLQAQLYYYQSLYHLSMIPVVAAEKTDRLIKSAEVHLLGKQYWQAECNYRYVLAAAVEKRNHLAALCLLADLYCDLGLWVVLWNHLQSMEKSFPGATETVIYHEKLQHEINELLDGIKKNWVLGRKEHVRRKMMEYLNLVPDDSEISTLRDVIYILDEEDARQVVEDAKEKERKNLSWQQLLMKAQAYLDVGDAEPAVGILQGLSYENIEKSVFCRESIGDIRLREKDFCSAVWHYRHLFADDVISQKLRERFSQMKVG
ncbi:MAG: motility associated factor glycosyltransferase family protein [Deltaproteobacteria bacterium]|nr:motility associated factor glycosyltransferase family protein [Deltaproteobacteria bacterium]